MAPLKAATIPLSGGAHSVTPITGDVVRVMDPGEESRLLTLCGRAGSAGLLDRRLFGGTSLIARGFDDAHGAGIPAIWRRPAQPGRPRKDEKAQTRTLEKGPRPALPYGYTSTLSNPDGLLGASEEPVGAADPPSSGFLQVRTPFQVRPQG
jgi:hypothetical protein